MLGQYRNLGGDTEATQGVRRSIHQHRSALPSVSASIPSNSNAGMSSVIIQEPISQSRWSTVVSGQMPPQLAALSPDKSAQRPVEKSTSSSARSRSNSASIARQDRTAGALSHSSQVRSSGLAMILEGQGAPTGYSIARSATPPTGEKVKATTPIPPPTLPNSTPRTSSMVNIKHSAVQPRRSIVVSEQVMSQLAVPSPVIRLQSVTSPVPNSRTDTPGMAVATDTRGELRGYSTGSRVHPTSSVGGAVHSSASPVWNSTPRSPSRIKTKDLISRHKQQNASDARPPSIVQSASLSRSPTSGLSHTVPLFSKSNADRIDSGIELWDYDPQGAIRNRRRGSEASANGHRNSRDLGPSSALSTNPLVGASNANSKSNTSTSLITKKSRSSVLGSPSPDVSRAHSIRRMSAPPPPQPVKTPLSSVAGSSSTGTLCSTSPGRREPFINRKPQPTSQSTSQGGATTQSGLCTPPRSSTPSSMSHSASFTTSTQATMFTPATSFSIPSRAPSPATEVVHKSWFRRNVVDPVKSKLGYGS